MIFKNSLISNGTQIGNATLGTGNEFNLAASEGGGNFWSDYAGCTDGDFDGFCDAPFSVDDLPLISPFDEPNGDFDADGIAANVDGLPIDNSNDFSDGSTAGSILSGTPTVTDSDQSAPNDGIKIAALDGPAEVRIAGGAVVLSLPGGTEVIATSGSVVLEAVIGPVNAALVGNGLTGNVTLASGEELTFDPTTNEVFAPQTNLSAIVVYVGTRPFTIQPGGPAVTLEVDNTPPVLTVPPHQLEIPPTSPDGAVVDYPAATATDNENPNPVVGCYLPSGSVFGVGITTVNCSANDAFAGGAVSWWPAEGNADDAADGNNGTLENGASFALGNVGQAFDFDGVDDHVRVPDSADWAFGTADFALDGWARVQDTTKTYMLVSQGTDSDNRMLLFYGGANNPPGLGFTLVIGGAIAVNLAEGSVDTWQDGLYHHFALARQESLWSIYVDGSLVASTTAAVASPDFSGDLMFGFQEFGLFQLHLEGELDELRIYDRPLSASEVLGAFNAPGNGATGSFDVEVEDPPPVVTAPDDVIVLATGPDGAVVNYPAATATDNVGVVTGPTCAPPSGTTFPIGATLVECTAVDTGGNIGSDTFTVNVQTPADAIASLIALIIDPTFPIWLNIPLSKSSAFFKPLSICEPLAVGMAIITP